MTSYYSNGAKRSEALYKKEKLEGDFYSMMSLVISRKNCL